MFLLFFSILFIIIFTLWFEILYKNIEVDYGKQSVPWRSCGCAVVLMWVSRYDPNGEIGEM